MDDLEREWVDRARSAQSALNAMGAGHLAPDPVSDALDRLTNRNAAMEAAGRRILAAWDVLPDWSNDLEAAIAELREVMHG